MPEDHITALNNTLNDLNEQRLIAEHDAAKEAYRQRPEDGAYAKVRQTEVALDEFWEAKTADLAASGNLPGLPDDTEEWFQHVEAEDERLRIKDLYADDPEAIAREAGVMKAPTSAANFAAEVDAWYQAVQPTGDIRRVRDQDRFDPYGYSQQPDAVAVQGAPVSKEFARMYQPQAPDPARWEALMQQPPTPQPGITPKL